VIERLKPRYEVILFWYNPNITDREEYDRRLVEVTRYAEGVDVELVAAAHDPESWEDATAGLDAEPEGGRRCDICYAMRLARTGEEADKLGVATITTTLSISPHKRVERIAAAAAKALAGTGNEFLAEDFKKQAGFERSAELSKEFGLYRQDYCGCEPSKREAQERRKGRRKQR
jgi:hypothetical protein